MDHSTKPKQLMPVHSKSEIIVLSYCNGEGVSSKDSAMQQN